MAPLDEQWMDITSEWVEEDGSGLACTGCGDICYLKQHRLIITMGGEVMEWSDEDEIVLCVGCWESVETETGDSPPTLEQT